MPTSETGQWVDTETGNIVTTQPEEGRVLVALNGELTSSVNSRIAAATPAAVPTVASAARTATANGTAFDTADLDAITGVLTVTVVSGTNPTLDVVLQTTADGTNYYNVGAFVQKTAAATADAKMFGPLGSLSRWQWTIGGTSTPTFTFSISATSNRDS